MKKSRVSRINLAKPSENKTDAFLLLIILKTVLSQIFDPEKIKLALSAGITGAIFIIVPAKYKADALEIIKALGWREAE